MSALKNLVVAAVRLAIVRHGLATDDCPTIGDEDAQTIADDVWNALNGIGTCDGEPALEVMAIAAMILAKPVAPGEVAYPAAAPALAARPADDTRIAQLEQENAVLRESLAVARRPAASAVTHNIERTSPMGGPFIGTCRLCGQTGLTAGDALKVCPNPHGVSQDDSIIAAIDGPARPADTGLWRCENCGEGIAPGEVGGPEWRWLGMAPQHKCPGIDPQAGHFNCRWFGDARPAAADDDAGRAVTEEWALSVPEGEKMKDDVLDDQSAAEVRAILAGEVQTGRPAAPPLEVPTFSFKCAYGEHPFCSGFNCACDCHKPRKL